MPAARFCVSRRCRRRNQYATRPKGRCTACGSRTIRLKFPVQAEAAENGKLLLFGTKLVIKAS